jgi:hypothetical protein
MGSNDGNAYRKELKDLLTTNGYTTDFIGSVKNGNMQDNDNEGHSGATIAQISGYADAPLRQKPHVRCRYPSRSLKSSDKPFLLRRLLLSKLERTI